MSFIPPLFDLNGKVAVVTGASRGIGQSIAQQLAAHGAKVVVSSRKPEACDAVVADIKANWAQGDGDAKTIACNITDREQCEALIDQTIAAWGQVDILVCNAGVMDKAPFLEMDDDFLWRVLGINLGGPFMCGQAVARHMIDRGKGGRIVNVASNSGIFGGRGRAAYGASKAGVIELTKSMALELAPSIRVNAVAPGFVLTPLTEGAALVPGVVEEYVDS